MGLLGGWTSVAALALVGAFLAREVWKVVTGRVELTPRQKSLRLAGGIFLMVTLLMIAFSPITLAFRTIPFQLVYWLATLFLALLMLLMAVKDWGEVNREFLRKRRAMRQNIVTQEDIDRLLRERQPKHPDDIGRPPEEP